MVIKHYLNDMTLQMINTNWMKEYLKGLFLENRNSAKLVTNSKN